MGTARNRAKPPRRRTRRSPPPRAVAASPRAIAEADLLRVARALAELGRSDAPDLLRTALDLLARTYGAGETLSRALCAVRLEPDGDPASTLAIGWAREQVRVALEELLRRETARGRARDDLPADTASWLLVAACEAIAHEPPGGAGERVEAILRLIDRDAGGR